MLPRIYIGKIKPNISYVPLLYSNLGRVFKTSRLFLDSALHISKEKVCEVVDDPRRADFFVLPHEYFLVADDVGYISRQVLEAKKYSKKLLVFDYSDFDREVLVQNAVVCRTSQYKYKKRKNEIMMPPVVEDLGTNYGVTFRKLGDVPTVGFCGWADYRSMFYKLKSMIGKSGVHKKGIDFRTEAINRIQSSSRIKTNFIIRKSYSGHRTTIELNEKKARDEYVRNMQDSDLALSIKGDGNYSLRFFEALSLGRIPLLLDTDCLLPLEDEGLVDYKKFVLRVNYKNLKKIDLIITNWYKELTDKKFQDMQEQARVAFERCLNHTKFLIVLFNQILPKM